MKYDLAFSIYFLDIIVNVKNHLVLQCSIFQNRHKTEHRPMFYEIIFSRILPRSKNNNVFNFRVAKEIIY